MKNFVSDFEEQCLLGLGFEWWQKREGRVR